MKLTTQQIIDLLKKIKSPRGKPSRRTRDDFIEQVKKLPKSPKPPKSKGE